MFSGAHFGENPSKSEPRRLPTGTHFLLFFMFSGPWASKGASCDLLGSRGPALGSPGARQNSNSLQKHTFYEGDFRKQPFRSRAGPRRLQKDTIPDRRHRPLGLYNIPLLFCSTISRLGGTSTSALFRGEIGVPHIRHLTDVRHFFRNLVKHLQSL